jgi:hypothetical protein
LLHRFFLSVCSSAFFCLSASFTANRKHFFAAYPHTHSISRRLSPSFALPCRFTEQYHCCLVQKGKGEHTHEVLKKKSKQIQQQQRRLHLVFSRVLDPLHTWALLLSALYSDYPPTHTYTQKGISLSLRTGELSSLARFGVFYFVSVSCYKPSFFFRSPSPIVIMTTVEAVDAYVQSGAPIDDAKLDQWVQMSDVSNACGFFVGGDAAVAATVRRIATAIVTTYLNNEDTKAVPLRRKTKFCLLLNNFALYKPVRPVVFECLESMTSIFEKSIKDEGTMPFDSELGRMSEHVLVLLMRVMDYKLKASAVHEFAEHNTQFAIQLLLAILLKEPPYEFELRCNCISGLLGFTQPQAFFGAGEKIEEHSCTNFTEKVDFMLNLMLRLQAVQVVSDVLGDAIAASETVTPLVQHAVNNTMRTIMNIFKFCSKEATQWRQHILLSTTFLDGTVMMYVQSLAATLHTAIASNPPRVAGELLHSLNLSFIFGAFATYHMEEASEEVRVFCTFFHDLFQLSIRPIVSDARLSGQVMVMYINLLHFMCNVDAMTDSAYPMEDLLPELTSSALRTTVDAFIKKEVGGCGLPFTHAWYQQFRRNTADTLVAQDSSTYQFIDKSFADVIAQLTAQQVPVVAPKQTSTRLLGEMPALKPEKKNKISIAKAAAPIHHKIKPGAKADNVEGVDADLLCALTGRVMKNPVSSPYGQTYEKEAIMNWLEQNGSVCPITGKPLTAAQLKSNEAVASKILQQMVRQSMATQPTADDDMYNF